MHSIILESVVLLILFNKFADNFSHIPYEWSLPTASKEERGQYQAEKLAFEMRRKDALEIDRAVARIVQRRSQTDRTRAGCA